MNQPITPINPIITIQALGTSVNHRDSTGIQMALATLADGSTVRGFVVNRDKQSNPILRTPQGDLVIESEVFIKTGSEVVFRVDASQASRARILTIDNLTPEEYTIQAAGRGLAEDTIAGSSLPLTTQTTGTKTAAPPVLQAIVLQSQLLASTTPPTTAARTAPATTPTALPQLTAGAAITLTVLDVKLPPLPVAVQSLPQVAGLSQLLPASPASLAAAVQPPSQPPPPAAATPSILPPTLAALQGNLAPQQTSTAPSSPAVALSTPYAAAPLPQPLPPQQPGTPPQTAPTTPANILPQAPAPTAGQPAPATPPVLLQATVIGHGEDGANILHTANATLKLFTPQPLPTGTTLTVEAQPHTAQPLLSAFLNIAAPTAAQPLSFTYLSQAMAQLMATDPTLARDVQAKFPTIGPKFTSGLLFFLGAVKQGNLRELLDGRLTSRLDALAPELLSKLSKDIGTLQQNFIDPPQADWKTIPLPLMFGNSMEPAHLYIRRDSREGGGPAEASSIGQRFVIDIDFSELGPIQFDGFVRQDTSSKSLELFMRSGQPLAAEMTDTVRHTFENALKIAGIQGQIIFQQGLERFVKPQARPADSGDSSATHTILA